MQANRLGSCPGVAKSERVRVKLRNGATFEAPADGKGAVDWSLGDHPFDVVEWELVK